MFSFHPPPPRVEHTFEMETRIKFYSQEIIFFRQDILYRMRRACLMPPSTEETSDPFEHVSLFFHIHHQVCDNCYHWILSLSCRFVSLLQLVATITHQSHLCPLPLSVQPIIWNYDHCLHLYPTPHTVLLISKHIMRSVQFFCDSSVGKRGKIKDISPPICDIWISKFWWVIINTNWRVWVWALSFS